MNNSIALTNLKQGDEGFIVEIMGGHVLLKKLNSLGIRSGKKITKISHMMFDGPVTVGVGNTRIAVGRGMANKIMVKKI